MPNYVIRFFLANYFEQRISWFKNSLSILSPQWRTKFEEFKRDQNSEQFLSIGVCIKYIFRTVVLQKEELFWSTSKYGIVLSEELNICPARSFELKLGVQRKLSAIEGPLIAHKEPFVLRHSCSIFRSQCGRRFSSCILDYTSTVHSVCVHIVRPSLGRFVVRNVCESNNCIFLY